MPLPRQLGPRLLPRGEHLPRVGGVVLTRERHDGLVLVVPSVRPAGGRDLEPDTCAHNLTRSGGEGAAVGLGDGEQRPVEVAQSPIAPREPLVALGKPQPVQVGRDVPGEGQGDGDDQASHGG